MKPLAFITGASSGIGQALALRYLRAGYRVALVARRTGDLQTWAQAHSLAQENYAIYGADVANIDGIVAASHQCLDQQGIPDVVIANAGISVGMDTREREDLDVMARVFATNNIGMAATFHAFVEPMSRRGSGRLVGIASVASVRGLPGHGAYCASKAGVVSYCESLRMELQSSGVKVVTLCPGYVDTPLTSKNGYSMPFMMSPQAFAAKAFDTIEAGVSYRVIPWQMGLVAKAMRLLPNALYDRLLSKRGRKPRQAAAQNPDRENSNQ